MDSITRAVTKHKEIFYDFLTQFAHLDTRVGYCIASHFEKDISKKIEITDLLVQEFNSQKQFDVFLKILRLKNISETEVGALSNLYVGVKKMRNFLAHSYLVQKNNVSYNGKCIKLTYLTNSKGKGYTHNLDINDYTIKRENLRKLLGKMVQICNSHFNNITTESK